MALDTQHINEDKNSPIRQFFHGRSVFITGVTGFVGKALLEKLLRCCPGINKIYILMRPKRGKTIDERTQELLESKLFSLVQKQSSLLTKKIVVVDGDILKPDLGISKEDRIALEKNISVVFHSAARIKYRDPLRVAMENNVLSTQYVMDLCRKMTQITVVIHVSTSFCLRNDDGTVPEAIDKCKPSLDQVLEALQWMDDETLSAITPAVIGKKYNMYAVTKCLAENLISEKYGDLPAAIVRPSVISTTWKDPIPGWCDSLQGPSALFLAGSKGVLRTIYLESDVKVNTIPLDIVVNTLISTAWYAGTQRLDQLIIVNCGFDNNKLPKALDLFPLVMEKREKYPLVNMFRYPDFTVYKSKFLYRIHSIIDHYIPAILCDIFYFIFTGKTLLFRLYLKIDELIDHFSKPVILKWDFQLDNYNMIMRQMSEEDSKLFFMDLKDFDWPEYIDIMMKGGRQYMAKEDPSNIPYAKRKAKIWWFVTTVLKWCLICGVFYYFLSRLFPIFSAADNFESHTIDL